MRLELEDQAHMLRWCLSTVKRKYAEIKDVKGKNVKTNTIILKNDKVTCKLKDEIVGAEKKKIVPTDIGEVVNEFMEKYFKEIIDVDYTNKLEEKLDNIASNKLNSNCYKLLIRI